MEGFRVGRYWLKYSSDGTVLCINLTLDQAWTLLKNGHMESNPRHSALPLAWADLAAEAESRGVCLCVHTLEAIALIVVLIKAH